MSFPNRSPGIAGEYFQASPLPADPRIGGVETASELADLSTAVKTELRTAAALAVFAGLRAGKQIVSRGPEAAARCEGKDFIDREKLWRAVSNRCAKKGRLLPMKKLVAESLGTFTLVFAGTGAIVINSVSNGAITHAGIALTFGLVVLAMIYTFGDVSGAHLNPAVTTAFAISGRFAWRDVAQYITAQLIGAFAASAILRVLFPSNETLGTTLPAGTAWQSFVLEIILTFILMMVILSVSTGAKEKGITAGIAIGAVIGLEAMFAGPICGASMNPARSIAPAIVSGHMAHLWIYVAGPVIGAALAVPACCAFREGDCCRPQADLGN